MSKKNVTISQLSKKLGRVEKKCNRILGELRTLRRSLTPPRADIDEVIDHLHQTARAMREQSIRERRYFSKL